MQNFCKTGVECSATSKEEREIVIEVKRVGKIYQSPSGPFTALKDISFDVCKGEFIAVIGKSGSGKSTLMNIITGIDRPSSGEISVRGTVINNLSEKNLSLLRGKTIGVVFQFFQLLPTLTIAENVMLPMDFCNIYPGKERRERALALLSLVGVLDQADKLPAALSGGQQQRAAIARALANDPPLIAADEPTGNLDSHTSDTILQLFADLTKTGKSVIMVTHERDASQFVSREIVLSDGVLLRQTEFTKEKYDLQGEKNHA